MAQSALGLIQEARTMTLGSILAGGFGGVLLAWFIGGIELVQAGFNFIVSPLAAFGNQLARVVVAFVGGGARIIESGVATTVASVAPGATWAVGPLTFALQIGAAGAGLYVMALILSRPITSDTIPFSFTDLPFLGVEEDEDDD